MEKKLDFLEFMCVFIIKSFFFSRVSKQIDTHVISSSITRIYVCYVRQKFVYFITLTSIPHSLLLSFKRKKKSILKRKKINYFQLIFFFFLLFYAQHVLFFFAIKTKLHTIFRKTYKQNSLKKIFELFFIIQAICRILLPHIKCTRMFTFVQECFSSSSFFFIFYFSSVKIMGSKTNKSSVHLNLAKCVGSV